MASSPSSGIMATTRSIFCRGCPTTTHLAPRARLLAGQTELRRSRVRYAEEWLIAATRLDPRLVQAHRELIYIYGTQLRRTELNAEFIALSQLSNLTFDNAFQWCLLRSILMGAGQNARRAGAVY